MTMEETGGGAGIIHHYINGIQVDITNYLTSNNSTLNFYIDILGNGSISGTYTFNAKIDEVRIYNRTLSASEAQSLYNVTK